MSIGAASSERDQGVRQPLSLRSFITRGQLSAICDELSGVCGVVISVRDEHGRVLGADVGAEPVEDEPEVGTCWVPLRAAGERIGSLTISPGGEGGARERVERAVRLLGDLTEELCEDVVELRHRVREIRVHYRLSDLLVSGGQIADTLRVALDSALELLGLDAGSVVLLPEDADGIAMGEAELDIELQASAGLSERYLDDTMPLSRGRLFDTLALRGEVVTVEDLMDDKRVLEPERCEREGLASFINAGLVFQGSPLGVLRLYGRGVRKFTASDERLVRMIGQQAAMAVEQARLLKMRSRERAMQRALRIAGAVQQGMLPRRVPELLGLDVAARFLPSHELGGDFYDLFEPCGSLGLVVGDAVGKGVPAALLMSAARASLRAYAERECDPGLVLARVNDGLWRDTKPEEFVTIWYATVDPATREMRCASAGHEPPLLARTVGGEVHVRSLADTGGLVAGVLAGEAYETHSELLEAGDVVVAYTDGLTDACDFDGERFGRGRLVEAIADAVRTHPVGPAESIVRRVLWNLRNFAGLARQYDDETIVALRVG